MMEDVSNIKWIGNTSHPSKNISIIIVGGGGGDGEKEEILKYINTDWIKLNVQILSRGIHV